ncbi:hypothetical protein [Catalinimonas locisalis]|uniref:hypothetical protein n=1 Tax=Catalinimonas locisalis TaxID=3133978 RepID=UPI0031017CF7
MNCRDLNKFTLLCRKEKINFHIKKIVNENYRSSALVAAVHFNKKGNPIDRIAFDIQ